LEETDSSEDNKDGNNYYEFYEGETTIGFGFMGGVFYFHSGNLEIVGVV